jgi:hypothetical protein
MTTARVRHLLGAAGWVGGVAAAFGLALCVPAPTAVKAAPMSTPPKGPFTYVGAASCQQCHSVDNAPKNAGLLATGTPDFVRMNENLVWSSSDLHSKAYENLSGTLGRRMETVLQAARGDANYKVTKDVACLACHASDKSSSVTWADRTPDTFSTLNGVGCEMCHGTSSGWGREHSATAEVDNKVTIPWREWPPAVKSAWGLIDLRDPAVRADRCAGCHVGNTGENKFVTHEMYAAGHPPLPPLDLGAYSRDQPRHWGLPREMPYFVKLAKDNPTKAWDTFHYRDEAVEVHAARQLAVGSAATFKATARMLAGQATAAGKDGTLDFAAFDCFACHHDLKYPSPRQLRGYEGIPGRPTLRTSALNMVKVVADHAAGMPDAPAAVKAGTGGLDAAYKELTGAFATRSFGDPAKVKAACGKLEQWADGFIGGLAQVKYTPEQSNKLLAAVVAAGSVERGVADPETAQLLTWAVESLAGEKKADGLETVVVTRLRPDPTKLVSVGDRLKGRMTVFNGYDADKFRDAFRMLKP